MQMSRRRFLAISASALVVRPATKDEVVRRLASDRHRPQYHLMPPANWMNDPNAPFYWNGRYHMFYQYSPAISVFGKKYWGHAVSDDMVHWKNVGLSISPTPGGPDKDGAWSGSAVVHNGVPTIMYTGAHFTEADEGADRAKGLVPERQLVAIAADPSDPDLVRWNKIAENPVIASPPIGMKVSGWRDPALWKEGDDWYMVIGAGQQGVGKMVLLYRSRDLRKWEYLHPFLIAKPDTDPKRAFPPVWECPDLFFLENKPVLLIAERNSYFTGTITDRKFNPEIEGRIDYGATAYAQKTMVASKERRIWWAWLHEMRTMRAQEEAGWAGVLSLPRVLTLREDGRVGIEPAPELTSLRGRSHQVTNLSIKPDGPLLLDSIAGDCVEIITEIDLGAAAQAGVRVRSTKDGSEQTLIGFDRERRMLFSDTTNSSRDPETLGTNRLFAFGRGVRQGEFELRDKEPLRLHIFVDASVLEAFANGRAAISDRVYPQSADSKGIGLFARGGEAKLRSLEIWQLKPISSDRLTSGRELFELSGK